MQLWNDETCQTLRANREYRLCEENSIGPTPKVLEA